MEYALKVPTAQGKMSNGLKAKTSTGDRACPHLTEEQGYEQ
jgi:hypothetical protein